MMSAGASLCSKKGMLRKQRQWLLCLSQTSPRSPRGDKWLRGGVVPGDAHLELHEVSSLHDSLILEFVLPGLKMKNYWKAE